MISVSVLVRSFATMTPTYSFLQPIPGSWAQDLAIYSQNRLPIWRLRAATHIFSTGEGSGSSDKNKFDHEGYASRSSVSTEELHSKIVGTTHSELAAVSGGDEIPPVTVEGSKFTPDSDANTEV